MKSAIILHGRPGKEEYYNPNMPSPSKAHWIPWLKAQLLKHDIAAATPEVPFAYDLKWSNWINEVEQYEINQDTIIVGHSRGAGFWLRWLSEHSDVQVGKVILLAPPFSNVKFDPEGMFYQNFQIDPQFPSRTKGVTVFYSTNDKPEYVEAAHKLKKAVPTITLKSFTYGHFTAKDMNGSKQFPELLEEILKG